MTRLRHARRDRNRPDGAPPDDPQTEILATLGGTRGVRRLVSVCPGAAARGLRPGQTLSQARALCPGLVAEEAEPAQDAAALEALARWCTRYTPLATAMPPDMLWLDVTGCAHPFGTEAGLAEDLRARLARWDLDARWAIAGTPGAAAALACHAPYQVVPATADLNAALADLPAAALRLPDGMADGLRRLGLTRIGSLTRLNRAALTARFGPALLLRLDQALGATEEPIFWPPPPPDWTEQERFAEPILTTEACQTVLDLLARRLCARLGAQNLGGRQFVAAFQRTDGTAQHRAIATALPAQDPAYVLKLLTGRLDGLDPGFGIEAIALSAPSRETIRAEQTDLTRRPVPGAQALAQLVDALANRLNLTQLWRYAPRDSHLPERAARPVGPMDQAEPAWEADAGAPRPIRLFRRPERLHVTALLPDDPPSQFRWRGTLHRVRAATGPERIAPEWWHGDGTPRDYYQVEDQQGGRFWVFRTQGDWWLHGVFG
jgi:protein ImuB